MAPVGPGRPQEKTRVVKPGRKQVRLGLSSELPTSAEAIIGPASCAGAQQIRVVVRELERWLHEHWEGLSALAADVPKAVFISGLKEERRRARRADAVDVDGELRHWHSVSRHVVAAIQNG